MKTYRIKGGGSAAVKWLMILVLLWPLLLTACQRGTDVAPSTSPIPKAGVGSSKPQPETTVVPQISSVRPRAYLGEVRARDQVSIVTKISGRIEELKVKVGDKVKAGEIIVVLEHQTLDAAVKQAEAALAIAEINLRRMEEGPRREQVALAEAALVGAQAKLDALLNGATKEQITVAEAAVITAQAKLNAALSGPTKEQLKLAESELEAAKRQRIYNEAAADTSLNPVSGKATYTYRMWYGTMDLYDQQVQVAVDRFEALKAPPTQETVAQLKAAVDAAQAQLDTLKGAPKLTDVAQLESAVAAAKAQLELTKAPYTKYDLDATRAVATAARAALQAAQANQAEAFLSSPIHGVVATRESGIGTLASTGTVIVTIVPQDIEVVFAVEERSIGRITTGMPVSIITSTYQGSNFQGEVAAVAPVVNRATRTFDVYVAVKDSVQVLRPGMFVNVAIPED